MSLLRRRMMTQMESDPIPRERLVFSNAGDVILNGVTKKNGGAAICGVAIIHQTYYPDWQPYVLNIILMSKQGRDDNAVIANKWATNGWRNFTGTDGYVHSYSNARWAPKYDTVEEGIAYAQSINVNKLPILNSLTGKSYEGQWYSNDSFYCLEAAKDLLDYYYGVI